MDKDFEEQITSDDILGREAIDPEGEYLGIVMKLHIDRHRKELIGITIDQGFMKPDLFVGLEYIARFGVDAVLINKIPLEKYRSLKIYTSAGQLCGIVQDIEERNGRVEKVIARLKKFDSPHSIKGVVEIPVRKIETLGHAILLKKGALEIDSVQGEITDSKS